MYRPTPNLIPTPLDLILSDIQEFDKDEYFLERAAHLVLLLEAVDRTTPYTRFEGEDDDEDIPMSCQPAFHVDIRHGRAFTIQGLSFLLFEKLLESFVYSFEDKDTKAKLKHFGDEVRQKFNAVSINQPARLGNCDASFGFTFDTEHGDELGLWITVDMPYDFEQSIFVYFA